MDMKLYSLVTVVLMLFSSAAYAMQCDVEYRAKIVSTEDKWYGDVEKPEFKTGIVSGTGQTEPLCVADALSSLKHEGWQIKYRKVLKIY